MKQAVCSEAEHEAMKADGRFFRMPPARGGLRVTYDYGDGESETFEMRNCECGSTLAIVVASTPAAERSIGA